MNNSTLSCWAHCTVTRANFATFHNKSGWPSGLRRQTQGVTLRADSAEHSGPRLRAWVRIPLLTKYYLHFLFYISEINDSFLFLKLNKEKYYKIRPFLTLFPNQIQKPTMKKVQHSRYGRILHVQCCSSSMTL